MTPTTTHLQCLGALPTDLPSPPSGKTGWPWTLTVEAAAQLRSAATGGAAQGAMIDSWPKITIVTPSFGQGEFIEATIRSVLLQGYPNLEFIVIDGGSRDNTLEILQKYDAHLSYWVSEPDRGQTHAINKGFERASGEIIAWLNSDDYYLPGALCEVGRAFSQHERADVVYGIIRYVLENETPQERHAGRLESFTDIADLWEVWWNDRQIVQPEVFWRREWFEKCGPLDESLHYVMDYEYWLRLTASGARLHHLPRELAAFRRTPRQKSNARQAVSEEHLTVLHRYLLDRGAPFTRFDRFRLLANWTYVTEFLTAAEACDSQGLGKWRRRGRLLKVLLRHPRILASRGLWYRVEHGISQRLPVKRPRHA